MSDTTTTREDRRAALDAFANLKTETSQGALATVTMAPPAAQVVGAQPVAVRRDEADVLRRIKVLAAAAGEGWYFRFPVRDNRTGKTSWIEGPSVKLANAVALIYGNVEIDCREQDLGSAFLFHARLVDIETGFAMTRPFQQRKSAGKIGGDDQQRRENMAEQIGVSKAIRNVVVNSLQTFCDFAFEEAKAAIVDKIGKDLERWRSKIVERFSARLDLKRVEAVIGRTSDKWLAPDIARIIAMGKAVEDGMATLDESFPPLRGETERVDKETGEVLDDFAAGEKVVEPTQTAGSVAQTGGDDPAGAAPAPPPAAPVDDRPEIILKLLQLAAEKTSEQDRLEVLDITQTGLLDRYPAAWHEFVRTACATAGQIIRGETTAAKARSYLEGLVR